MIIPAAPPTAPDRPYRHGPLICRVTAVSIVAYALVTILGLLTLPAPDAPIADPYFSLMELLILLIAPLLVLSMVAVHAYAVPAHRFFSRVALVLMAITAGITSGVHFLVLTVGRSLADELPGFFSFRWPSVVYALDILAWDWFFALAVLFAVPVFRGGGPLRSIRIFLLVSGGLSLVGLLGVPLNDMAVRNIGIVGYAVVAPVAFWRIGSVLRARMDGTVP
jgi:hypothetical protein